MATLKDIAARTGVSVRTVTRALSGSGYVNEAARGRIVAVAAELGYRPNATARSLRLGRTSEVVVVSSSVDELHMAKIAGIERLLSGRGLSVGVAMRSLRVDPRLLADELVHRRPAGVIVIGPIDRQPKAIVELLLARRIPAVAVDSPDEAPAVRIDRAAGIAQAVRYLADRGRHRIAYVGPADSRNRIDGYLAATRDAGLPLLVLPPADGEDHRSYGRRFASEYPEVDAVQAYSDERALEFLAGLHDAGVRVPDDIALVGFDDRWAARYAWPPLTTVAQPSEEIGRLAAELVTGPVAVLIAEAEQAGHPPTRLLSGRPDLVVTVPTRLVIRESA